MKIEIVDAVHVRITGEHEEYEALVDEFTFEVPGFRHVPAYKKGWWDGKIRLFDGKTRKIYHGLYDKIFDLACRKGFEVDAEPPLGMEVSWEQEEIDKAIAGLNLTREPRPYQLQALNIALRKNGLFLMPTGSGKSLVIYMLLRVMDLKALVIVPTIGLVEQLAGDFAEYGYKEPVHKIYSGQEKDTEDLITISTWQSVAKMPKEWFEQFKVVIVDEAHTAKAKSITGILEKMTETFYRFGFTGTLDGTQTNAMVLEGLFGPAQRIVSTADLIEEKVLADFRIDCLLLRYGDEERREFKSAKYDYKGEIDYIVTHPRRQALIKKLVLATKGNTLVIFQYVEMQGKDLYEAIRNSTDREVYYIDGKVKADVREAIRKRMEEATDAILIGSTQTISTGINITSLDNIVFTSPSKSKIRVLQSIGRGLRRTDKKTQARLFDIGDDLTWKKKQNITYQHFLKRVEIYAAEQFPFKIHGVDLSKRDG